VITSILLVFAWGLSLGPGWAARAARPAAPASSPENIRISAGPYSEEPHLVIDGQGRLFAVWKEPVMPHCLDPLVFARSVDGGRTWTKSLMTLSGGGSGPFGDGHSDPWLAVDELDRIYCVRDDGRFENASCEGPIGIYVSRSDDSGLTWQPMVDLATADKPVIESDRGGGLFVTYTDFSWPYVLAARSLDGGATWSSARTVGVGSSSQIAARPGGKVFVAWVGEGHIMAASSADRGETWGPPVPVSPQRGSLEGWVWNYHIPVRQPIPSIVVDSRGSVFVAWSDRATGDNDIVISRSNDGGTTWSAPVRINDTPAGDQWSVMLAIDANDRLHAAWYDTRSGHMNLYYSISTDSGQVWSPNLRIMEKDFETRRLGEYFGLAAGPDGAAYFVWTGADGVPTVGPTWLNPRFIYFARTAGISSSSSPDRPDPDLPDPREGKPRGLPPRK
jgi:hypothetical protein